MFIFCICFILEKSYSQNRQILSIWEQKHDELVKILSQFAEKNQIGDFIQNDNKCGFWISMHIQNQWSYFSETEKSRLREIRGVSAFDVDTIIGKFRIFYDTSGINAPALLDENMERIPHSARSYIDTVGKYLNYVWHYIIDTLGYEEPPFRNGSSVYTVSIEEFGSTLYGETLFDPDFDRIGNYDPPRYTSEIKIDNDYFGYIESPGLAGLKVTLAHELHHAVQIGSYGIRSKDMYFYEITSTWMEDVIFDEVNDYYQYLSNSPLRRSHFAYPDVGFVRYNGSIEYSRAIWGKYIEKRFDHALMLSAWSYFRNETAINALDHSLRDRGSSFRSAFIEWSIWNLNTGPDADTIKYYKEGKHYPPVAKRSTIVYAQSSRSFADTIDAVSCSYRPDCVVQNIQDSCEQGIRMYVTVININIQNPYSLIPFGFIYQMAPDGDKTYKRLSNDVFVKLEVIDPENWVTQENIPAIFNDVFIYPNPYLGSTFLNFRLPPVKSNTALLTIFKINMDRVQSCELPVESAQFEPLIRWDGRDENGNIISSGIYIYVISVDGKNYTGKFAVLQE